MKTKKQKVIKNKTRKISLKNDFYSYINRKWLNTIKIKNDDVKVDEYTILEDKVKESIYKNIILKNKNKNSVYLKESLTKYHNKKVEEKLLKLLEHLKFYLENENNLYKFLKFCFEENINVPFEFNIEVDKEDPTKFITVIDEEDLSFVNKDYYLLKSEYFIKAREHYKKYLHELLKNSLEPLNESYDINNIIEIEKKIAKIKLDIELTRYTSNIFNKLKTNKLKKLGFDWKEFSENMKLNKNIEYVNVSNIDYLKKIMKYLKNWNNEPWISYWKYNIVKSVLIYHKDWSKIDFNFFRNKLIGQKKAISMKQVFIDKYFIYYNTYISKEYIKNFEFKGNLKMVNELFYKIRNVYFKRIEKNTWLDNETKNRFLEKLKNIKLILGYKNNYIEDGNYNFLNDDALQNRKEYTKWKFQTKLELLKKKIDKNTWRRFIDINTFDVNAYYVPVSNEVIIPLAILQRPFVDISKPLHYNMAYFGTTLAHEITHAFNDDGREYDEYGKFTDDFWKKKDILYFDKKSEKIKNMYKKYALNKKIPFNKEYSYGENFADIIGLLVSEEVVLNDCFYNDITNTKRDNILKEFYVFYVKQWRSKLRKKYKFTKMLNDEHSTSLIRCNCSLMMSEHFLRVYNVKKNDLMFNSNIDSIF
tara:strand:- start:2672 stop:4606 length:1935 start_codon:yes stop_codon:yes gene_type:complete